MKRVLIFVAGILIGSLLSGYTVYKFQEKQWENLLLRANFIELKMYTILDENLKAGNVGKAKDTLGHVIETQLIILTDTDTFNKLDKKDRDFVEETNKKYIK